MSGLGSGNCNIVVEEEQLTNVLGNTFKEEWLHALAVTDTTSIMFEDKMRS